MKAVGAVGLALVIAGLPRGAAAEAPAADFERISLEQGLSQSIIEQITQDPKGFLWFATEDGLNRYDGYRFTVFRNIPGNAASLSHNELKAVRAARDGALWVGFFQGGLNRFDPSTEKATRWAHEPAVPSSLAAASVRALLEARDGALWVGTQGGGLDRLDPKSGLLTHHPAGPGGLPNGDVRALCQTQDGALWIGTNGGGLARRDPDMGRVAVFRHDPSDPRSLAHDAVYALLADRRGTLWVGTYGGGLDSFDPSTSSFVHHPLEEAPASSPGSVLVRALCEDHTGALWVGTDGGGVIRRDPETGGWTRYRHDPIDARSLATNRVWSLFEDRSRVLWVGTYGGGLSKLDLAKKRFRLYRSVPGNTDSLGHDIVWSFFEEGDVLWIGTDAGGLDRFDRKTGRFIHYRHDAADPMSLSHDTVRVVFVDRTGDHWVATNGGGLDRFDPATGRFTHYRHDPGDPSSLAHDELRSVMQARDGALYVGTFGGGLDRLDTKTGRFTHYRHDPKDSSSLSNDFARMVVEDRDDTLWVGTQGGGLNRLDSATGRFARFLNVPSDPTSLSNNYVFAVLLAKDGTLWLGTFGGGLCRLDRATGRFERWGVRDGLASDSVYAMLEDGDGRLWISTTNGLSRFDPKSRTFRNFDVRDGLQSNEFNGGAALRTSRGELIFGGIRGFNAFFPGEITSNPESPSVVLTDVRLLNRSLATGETYGGRVLLPRAAPWTESLRLAYDESFFSLEFAALHFSAPEKNRYLYRMEGFREEWIPVDASQRVASFTGLPPGRYVFRVKAANADGVWNESGTALSVVIDPPFWATWWFRLAAVAAVLGVSLVALRGHLRTVRMRTQLAAAHEAQMSILPQAPPEVPGLEVWGACIPASEVGGDFYDWFVPPNEPRRLFVAVGDVAGKAMQAAMTAVMADGMLAGRGGLVEGPDEVLTGLNAAMRPKLGRRMFTALCLVEITPGSGTLRFANAGLCEPLLKTADGTTFLAGEGPSFPLGAMAGTRYLSRSVTLAPGDVVLLCTDGVPEAARPGRAPFGYEALRDLIARLDTSRMTARAIVEAVVAEVRRASGGSAPTDDVAVVAIRYLGSGPEAQADGGARA